MIEPGSSPVGSSGDALEVDARSLAPRDGYELLTRIVAPRPIAFVSSLSANGLPNLAPFSYFNLGGMNPLSVVFSVLNTRHGRPKDTLLNVRETREYVVNAVTYAMAEQMNVTSAAYPRGVSEWEEAGFTPEPSARVRPARVAQSPIALECRLHCIVPHGAGPLAGHYIIGEVVWIRMREDVLADGKPDPARLDLIGRMGMAYYCRTTPASTFSMERPPDPPGA
jgi:flavin reductase (DIM6/NTAB) family NADH-FMN oxidoreductase RutF